MGSLISRISDPATAAEAGQCVHYVKLTRSLLDWKALTNPNFGMFKKLKYILKEIEKMKIRKSDSLTEFWIFYSKILQKYLVQNFLSSTV